MPTLQEKIQAKDRKEFKNALVKRFLSSFKSRESKMPDSIVRPKEDRYNKLGSALKHPKPGTSSSIGKTKSLKGGEPKAAAMVKSERFRERHNI